MHRLFRKQHDILGDLDGPLVGAGQELPGTCETLAWWRARNTAQQALSHEISVLSSGQWLRRNPEQGRLPGEAGDAPPLSPTSPLLPLGGQDRYGVAVRHAYDLANELNRSSGRGTARERVRCSRTNKAALRLRGTVYPPVHDASR